MHHRGAGSVFPWNESTGTRGVDTNPPEDQEDLPQGLRSSRLSVWRGARESCGHASPRFSGIKLPANSTIRAVLDRLDWCSAAGWFRRHLQLFGGACGPRTVSVSGNLSSRPGSLCVEFFVCGSGSRTKSSFAIWIADSLRVVPWSSTRSASFPRLCACLCTTPPIPMVLPPRFSVARATFPS